MKPRTNYKKKLLGALQELDSVESSLNMPPIPIKNPVKDALYLTERDENVAHSVEHIHTVRKLLNEVYSILISMDLLIAKNADKIDRKDVREFQKMMNSIS